jgi:hypothetical protein|tara:strand:+ start:152 stop:688 length:537 start_codon:yes stop_codon:yes gene_type:complete
MSEIQVNTINEYTSANGVTIDGLLIKDGAIPSIAGGKVLQVVQGTLSSAASSNSQTYADTGLTADITPSATSSKVLVILSHNLGLSRGSDGACDARVKLVRASTDIWGGETLNPYLRSQAHSGALVLYWTWGTTFLDSPSTTSATTYKTQYKSGESADTVYVSTSGQTDTITLIEIGA